MDLFPSTLIIGKNPKLSDENVNNLLTLIDHQPANNPDLLTIDQNSGWGIAVIRTVNPFLCQKPYNHPSRVVLIQSAENLETEAQNALLKNLEEPGDNRFFILTTTNIRLILPTIVSRCHLIFTTTSADTSSKSIWLIPPNTKDVIKLADSLSVDKTAIRDLLSEQLQLNQQLLLTTPNLKIAQTIGCLIKTIDLINHNVDPRSALDYFLLKQI